MFSSLNQKFAPKKNQQNFGTLRKKVGVCILNIWKLGQKKMLQLSYKTLFYRFPKVLRCSFSWSFPFDTLNKNIDLSSRGHQPCEHVNPPAVRGGGASARDHAGDWAVIRWHCLSRKLDGGSKWGIAKGGCDWVDARVVVMGILNHWVVFNQYCLCWTFLLWLDKRHNHDISIRKKPSNALFGSNLPYSGCNHHHQDDITLSVGNPQPKPLAW